ncbi:FAD-dependent monooxygenase [Alteromonas sp. ASW11-19]|uniref:FAD-dependent monooxygenase n=1 Tax=Alteromonas salexigens TaxID=2982530 RepID=A0ABT2VKQ0_9ALTE|nr:FAD-dependent monooxygenase [Alteromonas salexigens]MCU7553819.1 FAD-dependent monooxygenase [Alteromonas salexigens]
MYDFCINGGGMVGATLALGLARQGYQVAVIEPVMPPPFEASDGPDLRVSAISEHSADILRALGAWEAIEAMRVRPYDTLSVWENDGSETAFTANMLDMQQLGYFVENRVLQLGCHEVLQSLDNVTCFVGNKVRRFAFPVGGGAMAGLVDGTEVQAQWLVGADGAQSVVRKAAEIGTTGWQYDQRALGMTVKMSSPATPHTWQRFYPSGPRALLPMYDNYASLVWYDSADQIQALARLDNAALAEKVSEAFPSRLTVDGTTFTVLDKAAFPLTRAHASRYVTPSVILVGDAAHTVNPLAGQGVNLGFRDIECLLSVTADHPDLTSAAFFRALQTRYEKPRQRDNRLMMAGLDSVYALFSNDLGPIKWVRNQVLAVTEKVVPAKREVMKYALGLHQWKF